jgi:tol-pal system protein YbgF
MAKPHIYIALLVIIGPWGCASTDRLNTRVDLMEKEVADLHQANRRILRRLDEMQMQLSLLKKNLPRKSAGTKGVLPKLPALRVVKLHPGKKDYKIDRPRSKKVPTTFSGAVDPKKVSERLAVDHAAARRPILEPDPDGEDDETIVRKFGHACSFYNAADFKTAIPALRYFIELHPEHPLAIDALHLVGEAKLAQGKVREAQLAFNRLTERHPKSKRAISALFMVGRCEEKLGHVKQARSTYLQLVEAYPLSREAAEANRRLQAMR